MLLCANHWAGVDISASRATCFYSDKVNTAATEGQDFARSFFYLAKWIRLLFASVLRILSLDLSSTILCLNVVISCVDNLAGPFLLICNFSERKEINLLFFVLN